MRKSPTKSKKRRINFSQKRKQQILMGVGFYLVLTIVVFTNKLSWLVLVWYVVLGGVTYLIYAKDKRAAKQGQWRIPETTLHVLSALGGWVGAMMAQNFLRHKTQKAEFRLTYYLTVLINLAGLMYLLFDKVRIGI